MTRSIRLLPIATLLLPVVAAWAGTVPARAADLSFAPFPLPVDGAGRGGGPGFGGGFRVASVPVRPAPRRYDVFGYPVLPGVPSPLATGSGCPAAIQPDYDPDGNLAGYAPIPMCR